MYRFVPVLFAFVLLVCCFFPASRPQLSPYGSFGEDGLGKIWHAPRWLAGERNSPSRVVAGPAAPGRSVSAATAAHWPIAVGLPRCHWADRNHVSLCILSVFRVYSVYPTGNHGVLVTNINATLNNVNSR
jgi:hypothetical protein